MRITLIVIILFAAFGCKENPYPSFTEVDGGAIYYKLHMFGDNRETAKVGDYITADISYLTMGDSLFFKGKRTFQLAESGFVGSIEQCFMMMAQDDSASFIISADGLFEKTLETNLPSFIAPNSNMKVGIRMYMIRSEVEYQREKEEFLAWIEDFGDYEQTVLRHFIEEQKINIEPSESGMYFIPLEQGDGRKVEKGDIVTVNYEGKFLNGEFFDSTVKRKQPFEFVYGTEWQVIRGLEEAIGKMRKGDRALIILPSELAWGADGSSTGIIPPFTSVIYEIELIDVRSREEQV
jgi:FKBP-type peptidyl-prolyl cis-trans isomerase FkpA